jgi:hypothetical protein
MNVVRRWLVVLIAAPACVGFAAVAAGFLSVGPLAALGVTETELQPQVVRLLDEGADPLVMIGVTWMKGGYCSGQFKVQVAETATEVRVGMVLSRENRGVPTSCAGFGTIDNMAWAPLRLSSPLGERVMVRDSDGSLLPIQRWPI